MKLDLADAPWPVVGECFSNDPEHLCAQCDGSHDHIWIAWKDAPFGGSGIPVRCKECGGRKCDLPDCRERRHHRGPHVDWSVPGKEFS